MFICGLRAEFPLFEKILFTIAFPVPNSSIP